MSFILDWDQIGSDGSRTFGAGTSEEVNVTVSTPENSEHKQWFVENGMLKNWDVSTPSSADIRFDTPVENVSFTLLDVDKLDKITIMTKDADGNLVPVDFEVTGNHHVDGNTVYGTSTTSPGPGMDDGSQDIDVTIAGPVSTLWIILDNGPERSYSGAVAVSDIEFSVVSDLDGTVEGTEGDDLIDATYVGDPEGDMIDNSDAILAGDAPQDDLVVAGAGDDTVKAGLGDDEIYAGSGEDTVYGGAASDTIYGGTEDDVLFGGGEGFNGTIDFNDLARGDLVSNQFADLGVTISSANPNTPVMIFDSADPTGGDHDLATNNLGKVLILSEDGDQNDPDDNAGGGTFIFDFASPAHVGSLDFLDIEHGAWIKLYDEDGNLIQQIDTATTADGGQLHQVIGVSGVARMEVTIAGSGAIDNLNYAIDGDAGDTGDIIFGGEGDDYIEGRDGDDTLDGGEGADTVFGNDDRDVIIGGAGDVVDGGAGGDDFDILDLTGQGPFFLDNVVTDGNGNGINGTVVFVDGDGNPTGETLSFTEIEQILGDDIGDGPNAKDDSDTTLEDTPVTIDVLANDSDPNGDTLTVISATSPDGTVVINDDGTLTFTPNPDFNGEATITYTVTDPDGNTDTANVIVTVTPVNDAPEARDSAYVVDASEAAGDTDANAITDDTGVGVDSDPENDPLTVVAVDGAAVNVSTPTAGDNGGLFTINPDGSVDFDANGEFDALGAGETESTTVTYTIDDGNGGQDSATVTFTVTGTNDAPIAVRDDYTADEDTVQVIGNVLDNDVDPDGDPLTVAEVNGDPNGVGQPVPGDNGGLITIGADGTVTFDPNGEFDDLRPGETTTTEVTYTVKDPEGQTVTETVTITVDGINDDPIAEDNSYVVNADEAFGDADGNVLTDDTGAGRDRDPESTALKVVAVAGATAAVGTAVAGDNGGEFIINEDGTVDFNANGDFDSLALGQSAQTSVTYTIEDEDGGTDTATVTFTVGGMNDGTVQGTDGADVIVPGYVDADGDIVDGNDAILPGDTGNDDLIFGMGGDDSIDAGDGNDEVFGGTGNDIIDGNVGDDTLSGDEGDDVITGGDGNDLVFGGIGNDVIDTSNPNADALPDVAYPGIYDADVDPNDDLDTVFGGAGNDSITTGDDDDEIYAGSGDDTVDAGWDDDLVEGGSGNDTIIGNEGNDEIYGQGGDDLIFGGLDNSAPDVINIPDDGSGPIGADLVPENNGDTIFGGEGNDTIFGKDDDDTLFGGTGNDVLDGGVDDDLIDGDEGNDTLLGGQGDDTLLGGDGDDILTGGEGGDVLAGGLGSDTFVGGNGGDNVVGGEDPDNGDIDVLDLSSEDVDSIVYNQDDPESGVVTFQDGSTMTFAEIENVIPCFTPGTTIATPTGERLVEDLRAGDRIITRDNGIQEIAWTGQKVLDGKKLSRNPHLKPILIKAGSLGDGLPERDMLVSPNHRVLVASEMTQLYFEEREVLAAAKHMTGARGIHAVDAMSTTYIHFMCERHEVVLSNGAWTESFQPGDYSLKGIGNSQRNEILELFPELSSQEGLQDYQAARKLLKKHEAHLLMK